MGRMTASGPTRTTLTAVPDVRSLRQGGHGLFKSPTYQAAEFQPRHDRRATRLFSLAIAVAAAQSETFYVLATREGIV